MSSSTVTLRERASRGAFALYVLPALVVVVIVFVIPVLRLLWLSVTGDNGGSASGTAIYRELLGNDVVMRILWRTVTTAVGVTVISVLLAYPYAYVMSTAGPRLQATMLAIVVFSFWAAVMARTFAWIVLLQRDGPVDRALGAVGLHDVTLLHNSFSAYLGMVQVMMPYLVLVLYSSMRSIDPKLMVAASTLGASRRRAFFHVYFPLTAAGVESGVVLVYVISLGFYITPALLGSPQNALMSQFIDTAVSQQVDFPRAGALSTMLIVCGLVGFVVIRLVASQLRKFAGVPS
ncbi:MAG: ABC transporter permease [Nocardioidaceae bacterium]